MDLQILKLAKDLTIREGSHYAVDPQTGCFRWGRAVNSKGYGVAYTPLRLELAHRLHWQQQLQKQVPVGMQLDHRCRNPLCVNPEHLEVVTADENRSRQARALTEIRQQQLEDAAAETPTDRQIEEHRSPKMTEQPKTQNDYTAALKTAAASDLGPAFRPNDLLGPVTGVVFRGREIQPHTSPREGRTLAMRARRPNTSVMYSPLVGHRLQVGGGALGALGGAGLGYLAGGAPGAVVGGLAGLGAGYVGGSLATNKINDAREEHLRRMAEAHAENPDAEFRRFMRVHPHFGPNDVVDIHGPDILTQHQPLAHYSPADLEEGPKSAADYAAKLAGHHGASMVKIGPTPPPQASPVAVQPPKPPAPPQQVPAGATAGQMPLPYASMSHGPTAGAAGVDPQVQPPAASPTPPQAPAVPMPPPAA